MGVSVRVFDGVDVGTPINAVDCGIFGEAVIVGNAVGVDTAWVTGTGSGVASPACILIHWLKPVRKVTIVRMAIMASPVNVAPLSEVG